MPIKSELWSRTAFCTCTYLKSTRSKRREIVSRAMSNWDELLSFPFAERIFLDDRSPDYGGIKLLQKKNLLEAFDQVSYQTKPHPPHSNFGIVSSFNLCRSEFILHIDDDVIMRADSKGFALIQECLEILDGDPSILGINLVTLRDQESTQGWCPGTDYVRKPNTFAHPVHFFGTAACLIRSSLLEKVSLAQLLAWGEEQPDFWEKLVSFDVNAFLVLKNATPFIIEEEAWDFTSTTTKPGKVEESINHYKYLIKKFLGLV